MSVSGTVAGIETLVFADGAVRISANKLRDVLKTYKGTRFLTIEGSAEGLRIKNFTMPVLAYDPHPTPPAEFHIFPVGNNSALPGSTQTQSHPPEDRSQRGKQ